MAGGTSVRNRLVEEEKDNRAAAFVCCSKLEVPCFYSDRFTGSTYS